MKTHGFLGLLLYLFVAGVSAQEHRACRDADYPYQARSAAELRAIAVSCRPGPMAELYYYRAYYLDLITEAAAMSSLVVRLNPEYRHRFESHRLYMALIEVLAPVWFEQADERVAFLNAEYARAMEVAELRLRGYDRLADRLERQLYQR